MSLKAVHIFFIALSIILSFGFGIWSVNHYLTYGDFGFLLMGLLSAGIGILLIYYGWRFLRKLRHISYM